MIVPRGPDRCGSAHGHVSWLQSSLRTKGPTRRAGSSRIAPLEDVPLLRLTGFSTYPVRPTHNRKPVPGYRGLAVSGRCGRVDESRGTWLEVNKPFRRRVLRGMYFDEKSWDGSDFFLNQDPCAVSYDYTF